MSIFAILPEVLLIELFVWLDLEDVAKLDSALCSSNFRYNFLDLCSHEDFTFQQFESSDDRIKINTDGTSIWFLWTFKRGFRVDGVNFDDNIWTEWCNEVMKEGRATETITSLENITQLQFSGCFSSVSWEMYECMILLLNNCPHLDSFVVVNNGRLNFDYLVRKVSSLFVNVSKLVMVGNEETFSCVKSPSHPILTLHSSFHVLVEATIDCTSLPINGMDWFLSKNAHSLEKIDFTSVYLSDNNCNSLFTCKKLTQIMMRTELAIREETLRKFVGVLSACKDLEYLSMISSNVQGRKLSIHCYIIESIWELKILGFVSPEVICLCLSCGGDCVQILSLNCVQFDSNSVSQHAVYHNHKLKIVRFRSFNTLDVVKGFATIPSLQILSLDRCSALSSACILDACLQNSKLLVEVFIIRHEHLKLDDLHRILKQHTGIKVIRCSGCPQISNQEFSLKRSTQDFEVFEMGSFNEQF
jgi:hypothetical protein